MMRLFYILATACVAFAASASPALAKPPLEAFADVPPVRSVSISPDGKTVAYVSHVKGADILAKYDVATGKNEPLTPLKDVQAGGTSWVGSNYIILYASRAIANSGMTTKYEDTSAFAYNLTTKKIVQLLVNTVGIYPYQSGLGRIVGVDPDGQSVYMPAYMTKTGAEPTLDLIKVNLDTGRGARIAGREGSEATQDWILDDNANVIARVDFSEKRSLFEIRAMDPGGGSHVIYSETTKSPSLRIVGLSGHDGALVGTKEGNSEFQEMYEIALKDGALTGPLNAHTGAEIDGIIRDENKVVIGMTYSGLYPSYELFDDNLNRAIKAAVNALPDASVNLVSWSSDWSKILLFAEGGVNPPRYMLFDRTAKKIDQVARSRPDIKPEEIGEVITIEYKARDGLKIPALSTWPAGVPADKRQNLPMIVLPHGGPESYDPVQFDWLAQFLANEGYVVLQPNFRGSGGFGASFAHAGYGEWGRKMQDDVTDGAKALMSMGWADPNRTCIVGWSYGGYAALAGGALTPDLYKCVVAIAGVSDLTSMLGWEKQKRGPESSAYDYWKSVIGDPDKDGEAIEAVSPYRLAANFKAPVLLVHGGGDLTVPQRQSEMMDQALKSAGKQVTYIPIGNDDHSLVDNDSRRLMLTKLGEFIKTHIGE
ncbi:MAG: alpha/beta fold hydrolase [Hyphomonadaceae bacterium]